MRPLLSAALIVRDEARVMARCLTSLQGVVDEAVVVDTGSSDGTPEIAAGLGARVVHHPWTGDFAEARNVSLDTARGEWILYIDADEYLANGERAAVEARLRTAEEAAFRILLRPVVRSTPYYEYRMWRNDPRIRFDGVIHETIVPAVHRVADEDGRAIGVWDLLLEHDGYEGDQTHKHHRNLPLLRDELRHDPDNLFKRHHLARVLTGLDRDDEALAVLDDAVRVARGRPWDPLGSLAFTDLVRARRAHGDDVTDLLGEARALYPDNKLLWWVEASVRISAGRYTEALELLDRLMAIDVGTLPAKGPSYDERIFGEYTEEARGLCLFRLGRYDEAARAYGHAAELDPANQSYRAKHVAALGRAGRSPAPPTA